MANAKVRTIKSPDQIKSDYLSRMSDEQLQCRSGRRHRWPSDEIGSKARNLPKGITAQVQKGMYTITEECMRGCGRYRRFTTLSGGMFDLDTVYAYWSTEDNPWVTVSQDSGVEISGRDCKAEMFVRALPLIKAAAVKREVS